MNEIKSFNWKRNWNYFLAKLLISLKEIKEYRIDVYFSLFSYSVTLITYMFFYLVFFDFLEILDWSNFEFLLFFILCWLGSLIVVNFSLRSFKTVLLKGDMNKLMTLPLNKFLLANLTIIKGRNFFTVILNFFIYLFLTLTLDYEFHLILFSVLVLLLGSIFFIIFVDFFYVLAFFFKEVDIVYNLFIKEMVYLNEKFTPNLFSGSFFKDFFFLLPSAFYGYFALEVLRGEFNLFLHYLSFCLIIILVMFIITLIIWHYGLKKYEAFG